MPKIAPRFASGLIFAIFATQPAFAEAAGISLDINRLDTAGTDCRVTLVEKNATTADIAVLKLDLVVFDKGGQVTKRVAVDGGALKAGRSTVRSFDFKSTGCDTIGRVLLNGVLACEMTGKMAGETAGQNGQEACDQALTLTSRAGVTFDR
jgi:hypothetical protein